MNHASSKIKQIYNINIMKYAILWIKQYKQGNILLRLFYNI